MQLYSPFLMMVVGVRAQPQRPHIQKDLEKKVAPGANMVVMVMGTTMPLMKLVLTILILKDTLYKDVLHYLK